MRHITTKNLASFCMDPDEGMWEMDGRPPEPSEIEQAQARAGHVMSETDIAEMKDILHRSGIQAESRDGVLRVHLPKTEVQQPKAVDIKVK